MENAADRSVKIWSVPNGLGAQLKQKRIQLHFTQLQLARKLNISQAALSRIERGVSKAVSVAALTRIKDFLENPQEEGSGRDSTPPRSRLWRRFPYDIGPHMGTIESISAHLPDKKDPLDIIKEALDLYLSKLEQRHFGGLDNTDSLFLGVDI